MQRDLQPNEIDWVFCWRTSTGEVSPGSRDASMNLGAVRYQPSALGHNAGLRTIVRGRLHTCPQAPIGPRLDEQGGISRGSLFVWGYVSHAFLVPARNGRELAMLQAAAHAAVLAGDATEWSLATVQGRGKLYWAIHLGAHPEVVSHIAARVDAPWTLEVREKTIGSYVKGSQIASRDREGNVTWTLEADTLFDDAPLPLFDNQWTQGVTAIASDEAPTVRQTVSMRPVTIPDEDVEYDDNIEYDDAVMDLDGMMITLLESVGVEIIDTEAPHAERQA